MKIFIYSRKLYAAVLVNGTGCGVRTIYMMYGVCLIMMMIIVIIMMMMIVVWEGDGDDDDDMMKCLLASIDQVVP